MHIRKAILTGGGRATRLYPITTTVNKHLLPLANKPMIFHAIEKVAEAGIKEIFINTNPGETELQKHVGDGGRWGITIRFFEQTGGPQGIAHVVSEARQFIGDEPFMFYLSDNILLGGIKEMVESFATGNYDAMLAFAKVPDPERFGVPVFDERGQLIDVVEKPTVPPNQLAVTGIYLYGPKIFFETFAHIEKSARGEYEISSIHSYLIKHGARVGYQEITGWWKDTGKPEDLIIANQLLLESIKPAEFMVKGEVADGADIRGMVSIGPGSKIGKDVLIIGPVVIGEYCTLDNCAIGPNVSLGTGAKIYDNAAVENSIILDHVTIHGFVELNNSLLGKHASVVNVSGTSFDRRQRKQRMILGDKTVVEF